MVLRRDTEGTIKLVKDAKVAVFAQVGCSWGKGTCHKGLHVRVVDAIIVVRCHRRDRGVLSLLLCTNLQGVDTSGPETKGTVLIKSAEELESYSK
jgi:hypothetical protein